MKIVIQSHHHHFLVVLLSLLSLSSVSASSSPSPFTTTSTSNNMSGSTNQHTTRPIVTGTSVVGLKYDGGVLLAADCLLSYGSMAKSFDARRLHAVANGSILLGASGEYSDYQELVQKVEALALEVSTTTSMESIYDEKPLPAKHLWNYLRAVLYQRRSKFNPFWNDLVVAGMNDDGKTPFLGVVDKIGTTLEENLVATGFGGYLAMPLLREQWRPDLTEGEARALLEDCMKVLFFRDCRASCRIQLAKVTADGGCVISEPYELDHGAGWTQPSMERPVFDLAP